MQVYGVNAVEQLKAVALSSKGTRLPSIRDLAAATGVSTRTIQEAVQEGVRQGWLETKRGSGIWPKGFMPQPPELPQRLDALRLVEKISEEIQLGKLSTGQILPSPKDYSKTLGLHPSTVRKSLAILGSRGMIDRQGRTWKVSRPPLKSSARAPLVLCIGAPDQAGNLRMDSDREWDFWREIQMEAIRCGLEPRIVTWEKEETSHKPPRSKHRTGFGTRGAPPRFDSRSGRGIRPEEIEASAFGAIVSTWHTQDSLPLLNRLARLRIPTSVWIENQETLPGNRFREAHRLWFHDLAYGKGAGETMAEYLGKIGHQKVAWICPFQQSSWAQNRLIGLKESLPFSVKLIEATGNWISEWDLQAKISQDPLVLERLSLDGLPWGCNRDDLLRPLVEEITRQRCLDLFGPQLEAALSSGATLWVAGSDLIAQWCLHWLGTKGIQPPKDLAFVSFDDTREASRLRLSSLRFDAQGMARAMIRQILSSCQEHKRITHYSGHVVERASSMRCFGA